MAANIDEAIAQIANVIGVTSTFGGGNPSTVPRMATWMKTMFTNKNAPNTNPGAANPSAWDRNSILQRSVYNWTVPSIIAQQNINSFGESQQSANTAIDVVLRTLLAVKFAKINQRITQAQEDLVVQVYTAAWE